MKINRMQSIQIKRIIASIILFIILFGIIPFPVNAAESTNRVIRVGYYENDGFQEYNKETDEYSGYGYEFLMALSQYTNWTYEFVPCDFSEGLTMLQNGELDIMNNVSKTPEREEIFDFPTLFSGQNTAYLAMKPGDTRVASEDLKAIETIKIGLAEDSIYSQRLINYFEQMDVHANIVWYPSHSTVTEAFEKGDVDAYVITSSTKSNEHIILSYSPDAYYIATTKGNYEIVQELDSAITSLRQSNPYFEIHLKEKYYGETTENYSVLTDEEKDFVEKNPVVRVAYQQDWYPISYQNDNGEFDGSIRGIYNLLEIETGLKFEYVPIPQDEKNFDVLASCNAQILAALPCDYSYASHFNARLTKAFVTPPLVEIANRKLVPGDTVVLLKDDNLGSLVQRIYGTDYSYTYCQTVEECIDQVKDKKADGTVALSYESEYYRSNIKYNGLKYTIVDNGSFSLSAAVSNNADPVLYEVMQKGLNAITTSEVLNVFDETIQEAGKADLLTIMVNNPVQTLLVIIVIVSTFVGIILSYVFIRRLKKQNLIIHDQNEKLKKANSSTNEFLSRVSHDMRTPMNGILGIAELSKDEDSIDAMKISMGKIQDSGKYLLGLINDTLDYQKIESGRMILEPRITSTKEVIDNVVEMLKPTADVKGVELRIRTINLDLNTYTKIDQMRMQQILVNLISNSIKFTPTGGAVDVCFECIGQSTLKNYIKP